MLVQRVTALRGCGKPTFVRSTLKHPRQHIISQHIISQHITAYHITAYHITAYHITASHITAYHITALSPAPCSCSTSLLAKSRCCLVLVLQRLPGARLRCTTSAATASAGHVPVRLSWQCSCQPFTWNTTPWMGMKPAHAAPLTCTVSNPSAITALHHAPATRS